MVATTVLALAVVGVLVASRRFFSDARVYAATGGLVYTAVYLSVWALTTAVFWRFAVSLTEAPFFVAMTLGFGVVAATVQCGSAIYLYADRSLKLPIAGLFVASWICGYLFLLVGGESGDTFTLFIWSILIAPVAIAGIGLLAVVEVGLSKLFEKEV